MSTLVGAWETIIKAAPDFHGAAPLNKYLPVPISVR
jgi:hypothetical protein